MPDTRPNPDALRQSIEEEITLVAVFITLLEEEANVLADGADAEALGKVTAGKNKAADNLAKAAQQRNTLLDAMGAGIDKEGLETVVTRYPQLYEPVRQLLEKTAQASMLNNNNGRIISRYLTQNQQALDVLQHLTGRSDLYDAKGRKRPTTRPDATHIKAR